jgi:hypothetical protein
LNHLEGKSVLMVIDLVTVPTRRDRLLVVERIAGKEPFEGMVLRSPDTRGSWRITTIGMFQPDLANPQPNRLPIGVMDLVEGSELRVGVHLVEV